MDASGSRSIFRAAELLRRSQHAVALTGAGLSTRSGIPDFRSPNTGLWERFDPMEVASIWAFKRKPKRFYSWVRPLARKLSAAQPNDGHRALADMEADGWLKAVITQNIDGLHQWAGSREVLELHGDLREAVCLDCRLVRPGDVVLEEFLSTGQAPRCPVCYGLMKPSVIFIGEELPADVVSAAFAHLRAADVLLVAGSSLEMAPASELPLVVQERGGCIIVVNLTPTYIDEMADIVVRADVVEALPRIARACRSAAHGLPRHPEASGDSSLSPRLNDDTVGP